MKKWIAVVLVLALACAAGCAPAEETSDAIAGKLEDGGYVLTVSLNPEDTGEWQADGMVQDDTVVRLASSGAADGVFTARYEPTGDGEVSVNLRHFTAYGTCDGIYSFDLKVEGGKVTELTGGSGKSSPEEYELNPLFSGEWTEKETQFTTIGVTKRIGDGWDLEITSPLTRGAWVIRATAYYDCDYDALIYADGVRTDLLPDGEAEQPAASGLWGTLRLCGTEEAPALEWYDMDSMNATTVLFDRAPALPAYRYTGGDPVEGAIAEMLAARGAEDFLTEYGSVSIPAPIILKTVAEDDTHVTVYGNFWMMNYIKRGQTLLNISGGECPAVIRLEKADGAWRVASMEEAGNGDDYAKDIRRFADGDAELEEKFFSAYEQLDEIQARYIREYAEANGLPVTAYREYGSDPVPLQ